MNKKEFPYAVALSGGIATGKSTLKNLLFLEGFRIIEADLIAHDILNNSNDFISKNFGDEFIEDNKINRKKIGNVIFQNKEKRKLLEKYIHPKIKQEIKTQAKKLELKEFPYLIDIPLYYETKSYDLSKVVVVYIDENTQLKRLIQRDGFSEIEARARINSSMPIEEKRKLADYVVDNSGNLKYLQKQCDLLVSYLQK